MITLKSALSGSGHSCPCGGTGQVFKVKYWEQQSEACDSSEIPREEKLFRSKGVTEGFRKGGASGVHALRLGAKWLLESSPGFTTRTQQDSSGKDLSAGV